MKRIILILFILVLTACSEQKKSLPFLGVPAIVGDDSVYPKIRAFSFLNQDSVLVTNSTFDHKIYVADFIFLSCPSICPMMNTNMLYVYKKFENNPDVLLLSHTIDPEHDKISRLKNYSENINVSSSKWHFVTGIQDSIYSIAEKSYFASAYRDSTAPGGFVHSGGLLLIDKSRNVRGVYDGTDSLETERLIRDLNILLKE